MFLEVKFLALEQGSQTQNCTRDALRRKMSPRAADLNEKSSAGHIVEPKVHIEIC